MYAQAPLPEIGEIKRRLQGIFLEGVSDRNYLVREMAAKTVFVMLYIDAIEGRDVWVGPKQITRMSDSTASMQDEVHRKQYIVNTSKRGYKPEDETWYQDNTREPIRDETLRQGFVEKGAVVMRQGIPTTSSKGRYALRESFANLFTLDDDEFDQAAENWREHHLSAPELARTRIMNARVSDQEAVEVRLPGGGSRVLSAGMSSILTKAVIEEFATKHLLEPVVLWVSESSKKVVLDDDELMKSIGLVIDQQKLLPDVVLADLGRERVLIVFIEIVATDGPITERRKLELLALTETAGYPPEQIAFVSVFEHRNVDPLKRRLSGIAVDSLIWCMAEPDLLIKLEQDSRDPLSSL
ncbi:BsuBI/PstI family type II restriction endonuclease [Sulfurovum sp.]|uniref:BsuBI/PstI family type II restriction endonuclease n=1 Tax=Sulfurovum sp. TaxID=1969726 RepID=UPI003569DDCF